MNLEFVQGAMGTVAKDFCEKLVWVRALSYPHSAVAPVSSQRSELVAECMWFAALGTAALICYSLGASGFDAAGTSQYSP